MLSGTSLARRVASAVALITIAGCTQDAPGAMVDPVAQSPANEAGGVSHDQASAALSAVFAGNAQTIASAPSLVPPGAPLAPFIESRLYAISTIAMHDALNAILPRFERYADTGPVNGNASAAAAVLKAAHDAIVGADPGAQASTDAWYATAIAPLVSSAGYAEGVAIGQRAAAAILAMRASDGTAGGGVAPYTPGTNPGDYQFTFPFNTPAFDFFGTGGFADASMWAANVTPFVVQSTSQFRVERPYGAASNAEAVMTARYTSDYNEIKVLGCTGCAERSATQTEIGLFWLENSPTGWNRIAGIVADQRHLDAWETARLFALLQMGEFDSYASNFDSKYYYNFWRPVTAVALADNDGNPNTSSAANWQELGFPTPPVPDYPSAHSGAGGTAASIIEGVVPGRGKSISTTSGSLPGVTRTFNSVDEAAKENALSRILVGFHFRLATEVGLAQGRKIGDYIVKNALRPMSH